MTGVRKADFGEYAQQAFSLVRKDLRVILSDPRTDALESNGYGSYRLSAPPGHVSFDWHSIGAHWDPRISRLASRQEETQAIVPQARPSAR